MDLTTNPTDDRTAATVASTIHAFKTIVANRLAIEPAVLYGGSLRLSDVIARSPTATNSIDLMEAVAGAMAELDLDDRLELPALTLDDTVADLVCEIEKQLGV